MNERNIKKNIINVINKEFRVISFSKEALWCRFHSRFPYQSRPEFEHSFQSLLETEMLSTRQNENGTVEYSLVHNRYDVSRQFPYYSCNGTGTQNSQKDENSNRKILRELDKSEANSRK